MRNCSKGMVQVEFNSKWHAWSMVALFVSIAALDHFSYLKLKHSNPVFIKLLIVADWQLEHFDNKFV